MSQQTNKTPPPGASAATQTAQRFFAAAFSSGIAELICLPIDATRVRLQLQKTGPDSAPPRYTGMLQGIWRISADEGATALWRGWQPALVRQTSYTGLTFVIYEPVRNAIAGDTPKEQIPFYKRVLAGGTAGGVSIFAMNPTDVLKTQMQAHRGERTPPMGSMLRTIYSGGGLPAFWAGWQPNVARSFISNACEIGCYEEAKTRLVASGVPDGPLGHFAASAVAGTISAVFSTPPDVVKTRLMAQAGGTVQEGMPRYAGVLDCFVRMPQLEGVTALFKGFVPIATRKIAYTVAYFIIYEQALKRLRGAYS
jgi:hypothetical protein